MAVDVTELQIRVEALEVGKAERSLNKLEKTGRKTEVTAARLGKVFSVGLAAGAAAATGAVLGLNKALDRAKIIQKFEAQLKTATGSVQGASRALEELKDFAAETPFALEQSLQAFITLKNLGLDPSERALQSYGNTAAAMGKDLTQLIEAVADATTFEFERLKEFGIKAKQEANSVKFTFRGATTEIAKDADAIQEYLLKIGETEFAGAMADQMDTINGQLSNLEDSWNNFWDTLNERGLDLALANGIDIVADGLEDLQGWVDEGGADGLIDAISTLTTLFQGMSNVMSSDLLKSIGDVWTETSQLAQAFEGLVDVVEKFNSLTVKGGTSAARQAAKDWKELVKAQEEGTKNAKGELMEYNEVLGETTELNKKEFEALQKREQRKKEAKKEESKPRRARLGRADNFRDLQARFDLGDEESLLMNRLENERRIILEATNVTEEERTTLLRQHAEKRNMILTQLEQERVSMMLVAASDGFGAMADLTGQFAGKQSTAYKVMFGVSKGFALAEAAIALQQNIANASKIGFPQNIPMITSAIAQGTSIVSNISGINPSFQYGGIVGGSSFSGDKVQANLNSGEMVLTTEQQGRLFKMANGQGSKGGNGGVQVIVNNLPAQDVEVVEKDTENGKQLELTVKKAEQFIGTNIRKKQGDVWRALNQTTNTRPKAK